VIIWLVGLSGAGKTTIGREIYRLLNERAPNTVFIDGDEIRKVIKHEGPADYTAEARYLVTQKVSELCEWLSSQQINVIVSSGVLIFEDLNKWKRQHINEYFEVFVSVPLEVAAQRDKKGLYAGAKAGEINNVVGIDIPFNAPVNPDMVVDNDSNDVDTAQLAMRILEASTELFSGEK
jgi:cytidine diphosphoramidate kinase